MQLIIAKVISTCLSCRRCVVLPHTMRIMSLNKTIWLVRNSCLTRVSSLICWWKLYIFYRRKSSLARANVFWLCYQRLIHDFRQCVSFVCSTFLSVVHSFSVLYTTIYVTYVYDWWELSTQRNLLENRSIPLVVVTAVFRHGIVWYSW